MQTILFSIELFLIYLNYMNTEIKIWKNIETIMYLHAYIMYKLYYIIPRI